MVGTNKFSFWYSHEKSYYVVCKNQIQLYLLMSGLGYETYKSRIGLLEDLLEEVSLQNWSPPPLEGLLEEVSLKNLSGGGGEALSEEVSLKNRSPPPLEGLIEEVSLKNQSRGGGDALSSTSGRFIT